MQKFSGREYLFIDFANHMGQDKLSWQDRIKYSKDLLQNKDSEVIFKEITSKAEEPAEAYACYLAIQDSDKGFPTGYTISLDATSSGTQILACLTRDLKAAKNCNVISTGNREDLYTNIYEKMRKHASGTSQILRKDVKQAVMTSLYGSKAVPKAVFGKEGSLIETFENVMDSELPRCWRLNKKFLEIWCDKAIQYDWIMPDLFNVELKVMKPITEICHFNGKAYEIHHEINAPINNGRFLSADVAHSIDGYFVREMSRRCMFEPKKIEWIRNNLTKTGNGVVKGKLKQILDIAEKTGIWSYRIFDFINKSNIHGLDVNTRLKLMYMIDALPEKPFEIFTIHDCFRVHPNYGNEVRRIYNSLLAELWKSDFLNYILGELTNKPYNLCYGGAELFTEVQQTEYALS